MFELSPRRRFGQYRPIRQVEFAGAAAGSSALSRIRQPWRRVDAAEGGATRMDDVAVVQQMALDSPNEASGMTN